MIEFEHHLNRFERVYVLGIVFVGMVLRFAAISTLDSVPESDYAAYRCMALNLVSGKGVVDCMGNLAMYNMGYPVFILAPLFFFLGNNVFAVQFVNVMLGVVAIFLCYQLAKECGANCTGRVIAAALWAGYLPASVYCEYLAKENLMTPLVLGVAWCIVRLLRADPSKVGVLCGGCGGLFGLLALTGNAALSLVVPATFALVLSPVNVSKKISALSLAVAIGIAVTAPWMIRNYQVLGAPVLNTNSGFNLYLGNNPSATGLFVSISETPRGSSWESLRKEGELRASETLYHEAVGWIRSNPFKAGALAFRKAMLFWMPPLHEGEHQTANRESLIRFLWLLQFALISLGAVVGVLFRDLRTRPTAVLWLMIACYTAVHMVFYVSYRYREPIMPFVCVLAALTLCHLAIRGRTLTPSSSPR